MWEDVLSGHTDPAQRKLYGWRCKNCGEVRPVRVCIRSECKAVFGQNLKPDSKQKMCDRCWQMHKDAYLREHPEARKAGPNKGADNR